MSIADDIMDDQRRDEEKENARWQSDAHDEYNRLKSLPPWHWERREAEEDWERDREVAGEELKKLGSLFLFGLVFVIISICLGSTLMFIRHIIVAFYHP